MASPSTNAFAPEYEMLPPGVIFEPSDQKLVFSYLMEKVSGHTHAEGFHFIRDIDINEHEPSKLSRFAQDSGHRKMYFFTPLHQKGKNAERQVPGGFWKKTGKTADFKDENGQPIAKKTSLAYYQRNSTSEPAVKGQWLMKEYMLDKSVEMSTPVKLCVIYYEPRKSERAK